MLPNTELLQQAFQQYTEARAKRQYSEKMMLFGGKFAETIGNAKTKTELTQVMLWANKTAYMAGVPELAQQVNNLGRLQEMQINETLQNATLQEQSNFYEQAYSELETLQNGQIVKMKDRPEWIKAQNVPLEFRPQYYQMLAKRYVAEVSEKVVKAGKESYMYQQYLRDSVTGEYKVRPDSAVKHVAGGFGSLSASEFELLNLPPAVATQILKDQEQKEVVDYQIDKMYVRTELAAAKAEAKEQEKYELNFTDPNKWYTLENKVLAQRDDAKKKVGKELYTAEMKHMLTALKRIKDVDEDDIEIYEDYIKSPAPEQALQNMIHTMSIRGKDWFNDSQLENYNDAIKAGEILPFEREALLKEAEDDIQRQLDELYAERDRILNKNKVTPKQKKQTGF
jgi:hypothetical protein